MTDERRGEMTVSNLAGDPVVEIMLNAAKVAHANYILGENHPFAESFTDDFQQHYDEVWRLAFQAGLAALHAAGYAVVACVSRKDGGDDGRG